MLQGGARVIVAGAAVQLMLLEVDAGKGLVGKLIFGGGGGAGASVSRTLLPSAWTTFINESLGLFSYEQHAHNIDKS
jgi:hypothetical protein